MEKITATLTIAAGLNFSKVFTQSVETSGNPSRAANELVRITGNAARNWVIGDGSGALRAMPAHTPVSASLVIDLGGQTLQDAVAGDGTDTLQTQLGLITIVADNIRTKLEVFFEQVERHLRRMTAGTQA